MFMYPIFITDDPNASVEIPTLPGQRRWGVNKLEEFIGPLIKKGLESVILFGVPFHCVKVCCFSSSLVCVFLKLIMCVGWTRNARRRPFRSCHSRYQKASRALPFSIHRMRCLFMRIHRPRTLWSSTW